MSFVLEIDTNPLYRIGQYVSVIGIVDVSKPFKNPEPARIAGIALEGNPGQTLVERMSYHVVFLESQAHAYCLEEQLKPHVEPRI